MPKRKSYQFKPDGNDLKRVMYHYGLDSEDKIVCPFHDDHRPSCHINYDEGVFHCFACEASGDAFDFVNLANPKLDGLSTLILYYAILNSKKVKKLKLSKARSSKIKTEKENDKQLDYEIASDYYYGLKSINWKRERSTYKKYMLKRGFKSSTLNLAKAKLTYTNNAYPIIFPLMDMDTFKGTVCRTTDKRVEQKRKYLYSKGFSRVDTLAGRYDNEVVVLVEGYMDYLKMRQFGLTHVAAILGWKITSKQIDKLRARGVKTIISALDMDKPGRKGTEYLKNFFDVVEFQFPKGVKDPGDLNEQQFEIAHRKTKQIYRKLRRRKTNVNSK
jgi:DNA primase